MPELPEVESIAKGLREGASGPPLPGMTIRKATLHWPRHVVRPSPDSFLRRIQNRTIEGVDRRGKFLLFPLDTYTLLIHLRMSGDLYLAEEIQDHGPYDHTIFHLNTSWQLRFSDARKFGMIYLLEEPSEVLDSLGPEPLDEAFTIELLQQRLSKHRRMIKPLILDQSFLAGLGNIYADEALHIAQIHPLARSNELTPPEVERLWQGIRVALQDGLRHNGASIDWVYRGGNFQNQFRAYQRTGEPCPVCETPIERIVVGQRGTHFCPECQKEPSFNG